MSRSRTATSRVLRIATASVAALVLTLSGSIAAFAAETPSPTVSPTSASISGTVSAESGGAPIAGASIVVLDAAGSEAADVTTKEDGSYTVVDLAAGDYTVSVEATSFAPRFWPAAETAAQAEKLTLAEGDVRTGVDVKLATAAVPAIASPVLTDSTSATPSAAPETMTTQATAFAALTAGEGTISGKVVDVKSGAPIADVWVNASSFSGYGSARTDANGLYELSVVPGQYTVSFDGSLASYSAQYWKGVTVYAEATPVAVTDGSRTTGIDAQLAKNPTITGRVDIGVDSTSSIRVFTLDASGYLVTGTTVAADGTYTLRVGAGTYAIEATDYSGVYATQFYNHAATIDKATPITLAPGDTRSGVDFTPEKSANVAGNVSADAALDPTQRWATITAYQWGSDSAWHEASRITGWGDYSFNTSRVSGSGLATLPAGTYTVGFSATGFCTQYFDTKTSLDTADKFTLASGDTKTGVNAVLSKDCVQPSVTAGAPTISGTAQVGKTLTANPGDWQPAPVGLTYQWLADGSPIADATGTTLALTDAQLGKQISVTINGSRPGYTSASATSPTVGPVTAAPPKTTTPGIPTITGSTVAGSTLTAHPGTWNPSDVALAYQWLADGTPIGAATGSTFVPGDSEVGKKISVTVTGSKTGYADGSATSATVGPITAVPLKDLTTGTPEISGTAKVGETLTVAPGTWGPAPVALAYQWTADGTPIPGVTSATLTLDPSTVGKTIGATVRGSKSGYNSASADAVPVGPVAPGTLTAATPTISGTPQVGQTLTASPGAWGPQPVGLSLQWAVDGVPVTGATGTTFVPDATAVGKTVTVTATGTKPGFDTASRASDPTAAVARGTLTAGQPAVNGTPVVGFPLTASAGAWGPAPVDIAYQWSADGTPLEGATGATFTPTADLIGKPLSVAVTGSKDGYDSTTKTVMTGVIAPLLTLSARSGAPGDTVTVTGMHFGANEDVALELHSTVYPLGMAKTDVAGTFTTTITLPAGVTGDHHVVGIGQVSGLVGQAAITISTAGGGHGTGSGNHGAGGHHGNGGSGGTHGGESGTGSGSTGGLAATGSEVPLATLVLAIILVTGGGVLAWRRREAN